MRKIFTLALLSCAGSALADAAPVLVDVPALVHASQAQVEQTLGAAEFCRKSRHGLACRYAAYGVEVVFAKDKAEQIIINDPGELPYDKSAIARLGFKGQEPEVATDEVMTWQTIPGIAELSLFPDHDKIDYALVVVTPPPGRK
ncbi:hypothetical protein SAMN02949497_1566 [Methylomagnum ishizawai]|uniref:Uncharacterized protein n=1 Tax=Methylomagnum ishizawai TaxID=1760988 RepID=A0A1Y6CVA6_9GAMM|nr:hypothetical protein [Methylomagnum ishizawai]SMF94257.1 hypothetical protein SAMN02949497_1566 [Methylomagnum ishizawai]